MGFPHIFFSRIVNRSLPDRHHLAQNVFDTGINEKGTKKGALCAFPLNCGFEIYYKCFRNTTRKRSKGFFSGKEAYSISRDHDYGIEQFGEADDIV